MRSTEKVMMWSTPRALITTFPSSPSKTKGMATKVFRALPWAPLSGAMYASLDDTLTVKSKATARGKATAFGKTRKGVAKLKITLTGVED